MPQDPESSVSKFLTQYNYAGSAGGSLPLGYQSSLTQSGDYIVTFTLFDDEDLNNTYYSQSSALAPLLDGYVSSTSSMPLFNSQISAALHTMLLVTETNDPFGVLFSHVAKISLEEQQNGIGTIAIGQQESGVYFPSGTGAIVINEPTSTDAAVLSAHGDIWINIEHQSSNYKGLNLWNIDSNNGQSPISEGTWAYKVLMEEVLHSLGVDIYAPSTGINANGLSPNSNSYLNSHQYTVTSYKQHSGMTFSSIDGTGSYPMGLQLYDIYALQKIYGINWDTRDSNTTYSKSTAFSTNEANDAFVYTIWDGGGFDTIDASGYSNVSAIIDLRQGAFSSIGLNTSGGNASNNVAISYNAIIENATGTNDTVFGDTIIGNAWDNTLNGEAGDDRIFGDGVMLDYDPFISQYLNGDPGYGTGNEHHEDNTSVAPSDNLSGNDTLNGGSGDDWLYGGKGDDTIDGGLDFDQSAYNNFSYDYVDLAISQFDITKSGTVAGSFDVEITYTDLSTELDTYTNMERIAHAETNANTHGTNIQQNVSIASHGDGYVVVWESRSQFSTNKYAIMGQRYDGSGNKLGTEFQVSPGLIKKSEGDARVIETADGGFAVVWLAHTSPKKTYMSIFDSSGNRTSTDIDVFANDPNDNTVTTVEAYQDVATLSNGNMIVVAQASGNFTVSTDVIGQIIAPDGSHVGTKFICCTTQVGMQMDPMVTALSNGGFVVTWTELDGSSNGITAQMFDGQGGKVGGNIQINTTTSGNQQDSSITATTDGGYVVTWNGGGNQDGSGSGIYFRKFAANGTEVIAETLVNDKTSGNQNQAKVSALEDGGFMISFTDHTSTGGDIWAQQYDANGNTVQDNFLVNVTTTLTQTEADVTALNNGDFALAWETTTNGCSMETMARLYSNSAPIPLAPMAMMSGSGGFGSSTALASTQAIASEPVEAVDLYDPKSDINYELYGNGIRDTFMITETMTRGDDVAFVEGFDSTEGDVIDLTDVLITRGNEDFSIENFVRATEINGDVMVTVDRDGQEERFVEEVAMIFEDTVGFDVTELFEAKQIIV
jgi:hypothetical protein